MFMSIGLVFVDKLFQNLATKSRETFIMARFQWVRSPGVAWLGMYLWFKVSLEVSVKLSARVCIQLDAQ